ncbi:transposase [Protofrankia symbiont of Coriaria ruscifolia]
MFYLVRGGIAWRALPADFPPHQTVYALFRRWTRRGVVPDLRSAA